MRTVMVGSVGSNKSILEEMLALEFPISKVYSLDERYAKNVSGYYPIHKLAAEKGIPYETFHNINDDETIESIRAEKPDYIFVIGLSQLVKKPLLTIATKGVIGAHPTALPKFRGRAALVWQMLLGVQESKCTMFFIDEGMDSGDIIGQETYIIEETDYAMDVAMKLDVALRKVTRKVLHDIMNDSLKRTKQNEDEATYLLKRVPEDGKIDWNLPIQDIHRLIRAVSKPYPGAFTNYDGEHKLIIWRAECLENKKYIGINGQIAEVTDNHFDIVTSDGLLRVTQWENIDAIKLLPGHKCK